MRRTWNLRGGAALVLTLLAACGRSGSTGQRESKQEVEIVFRRMQAAWNQVFTQEGTGEYRMARIVLYSGRKETKCGAVTGPVDYCPQERLVAVEQGWARNARQRGGATLEYALARALARHVQHELTIDERVEKAIAAEPARKQELLKKREMQADCFVGLWRRFHEGEAPPLEELENAARAWTAETRDAVLEAALAERILWMQRGFDQGEINACNVFAGLAASGGRISGAGGATL